MQPDYLHWPKSRVGSYSVSTGYRWLCAKENKEFYLVFNSDKAHGSWKKKIWKSNVPRTIKHFIWKACSNALPTKENLMRRKIIAESSCHQCQSQTESILHALWDCASFRQVWNVDFRWVNHSKTFKGSFENLVDLILEKPLQLELFATIAWFLWSMRNKLKLKEEALPLNRIVFEAKRFLTLHQQPVK